MNSRLESRKKRQVRIRKKISGTQAIPRLAVFRSLSNIYGQLIDDTTGITIVSASSVMKDMKDKKLKKMEKSKEVGKMLAQRAKEKGIEKIVFDRRGYKYHGRVKALADSAREAGLKF